jgi:uncharacterized alpha-E superfamily protein
MEKIKNMAKMPQSKSQKLRELKKRLKELEEVKLKEALAKYGEAYQAATGAWHENAAWELADEEVSVLRAMITEIKTEIKNLEHPFPQIFPTADPPAGENSK